jgi:hypothetical protein
MENLLADPEVGKQAEALRKQLLDGNAAAQILISSRRSTLSFEPVVATICLRRQRPRSYVRKQEDGKWWKWNAIKCNWAILPDGSFHLIVDWS